jgi:hypothetical protein
MFRVGGATNRAHPQNDYARLPLLSHERPNQQDLRRYAPTIKAHEQVKDLEAEDVHQYELW